MLTWIPLTILAAFFQSFRNARQSQLRQHCSVSGTTLARFLPAFPLACLYLIGLYLYNPKLPLPILSFLLVFNVVCTAIFQILGTALMVKLFMLRNYIIGVVCVKSEAAIAAVVGFFLFSESLSIIAWFGVFIGGCAVWIMNLKGVKQGFYLKPDISTIAIGLSSGLFFALCSLYVRQSSTLIQEISLLNPMVSAAWVLFFVIGIQSIILIIWIALKEPKTFSNMLQKKILTIQVGMFGFLASVGWFSAMSLQSVAMVKTLGQIEMVFTLFISIFFIKEKLLIPYYIGLILIIVSAICVILG